MYDILIKIISDIPTIINFYDINCLVAVGLVLLSLGFLGKLARPSQTL